MRRGRPGLNNNGRAGRIAVSLPQHVHEWVSIRGGSTFAREIICDAYDAMVSDIEGGHRPAIDMASRDNVVAGRIEMFLRQRDLPPGAMDGIHHMSDAEAIVHMDQVVASARIQMRTLMGFLGEVS